MIIIYFSVEIFSVKWGLYMYIDVQCSDVPRELILIDIAILFLLLLFLFLFFGLLFSGGEEGVGPSGFLRAVTFGIGLENAHDRFGGGGTRRFLLLFLLLVDGAGDGNSRDTTFFLLGQISA